MTQKIVGIDLNEIIRGRIQKFDQCYIQEFGEDGISEPFDTYDLRNHYKFDDSIENTQYLNESLLEEEDDNSHNKVYNTVPIEYIRDENTGIAPIDALIMKKESVFKSGDQKFKEFLYKDYVFEIFGAAPPLYKNVDLDLQKFFKKYMNQVDIRMVSKENPLSIPSTLSFLSKIRARFSNYHFHEKNDEIWKHVDILITTDPELVASKPEGKTVIKITRLWNMGQPCDMEKLNLIDLYDDEAFQELVNYVKPVEVEETKLIENKENEI